MEHSKCMKWVERDKKVIAPCQHLSYFPLVVERAEGDIITDADGRSYIDFLSAASSLNTGSRPGPVVRAVREQLDRCIQYSAAYSYNTPMIEYAERLASVYPGGGDIKVCFGNCGSDCNDAAVKFARAFTGRSRIITFVNSYHGATYGSAGMSGCTVRMTRRMGPPAPEIYHFPFYGEGDEPPRRGGYAGDIAEAFETWLPADDTAAVIIEPMQGDSGERMAHPQFIRDLFSLCREHGILFISEEVQQGLWRTGTPFCIEHFGVIPDGIIIGKSAGGGFALGAFMARSEIMDCLPAPAHVFTLSGNHMACAAGVAAFDMMKSSEFQSVLRRNIKTAHECCADLTKKHSCLGFFRGCGMSLGIGVTDRQGKPDVKGTAKIVYRCYEKGLIVISLAGSILRIQPPLNISDEHLREGFRIIGEAADDYENGRIPYDVLNFSHGW